ncbi:MAG: DNA polymerase III subunit delta [Bryobacterales bacterium]|nr:DNA polymerase III subunit delta [Bryobacterales bacterium]
MTPEAFLGQIARQEPEPVYLFLGPDLYRRDRCRRALIERHLEEAERETGYTRHDLDEVSLAEVMDDLNSLSLFAGRRVVWAAPAEGVLPRGRGADAGEEKGGGAEALAAYVKNPSPGTILVFDSSRDFDGEDKQRMDRIRKFFTAVPAVVEFARLDRREARVFALDQARRLGLKLAQDHVDLLVESVGADSSRIASELEKLSLFRAGGADITADDIAALVPDAREATIFNLVNAIAAGNRRQSFDLLDTLVRAGEYLPLALTFVGGLFRYALAAKSQGLKSSYDIQNFFQRQGLPMWRSRAEQIAQVASRLPAERLEKALDLAFIADRDMKSTRPDDRLIVERFLLAVTR